jgi:DNA polymerase III subunit gamma/tau
MLSKAASNALLKTLEEPPGHVVFVLATTDPQKVLPTIRSRTQHFEFHLFSADELADHVRWVAEDAGLEVTPDGLAHAVRRGAGSARDALSALDQIAAGGHVSDDQAPVSEVLEALADRDAARALVALAGAIATGRDPQDLAQSLLDRLRNAFLSLMAPELVQLTEDERAAVAGQAERLRAPAVVRALEVLGEAMVEMREAPDARVPLEVAVIRLARADADVTPAALLERIERLEQGMTSRPSAPAEPVAAPEAPPTPTRPALGAHRTGGRTRAKTPPEPDTTEEPPAQAAPVATIPSRDDLTLAWGDTILAGLAPATKARFGAGRFIEGDGATAVFALPNAAHRDVCEGRRGEVEAALAKHFGGPVPLRLVVESDGGDAPVPETPSNAPKAAPPEDEVVDLASLEDAPSAVASDIDRLAKAFPGAELVDEETGH